MRAPHTIAEIGKGGQAWTVVALRTQLCPTPVVAPSVHARRLKAHSPKAGARAVILSPTRELALQTHKVVKELARFTDLRLAGA